MFVFEPLFTIFVLLFGGYVAKRLGVLKQKQSKMFLDFALLFALPCLIFENTYKLKFDTELLGVIAIGLCSNVLTTCIIIILGKILRFSKITLVSMALLTCFGNTLFVGIPIISAFYPDPQYMGEVICYDALATMLPILLFGSFVINLAYPNKPSLIQNIKAIVIFPPFIALILGLVCSLIKLPSFIFGPITLFGHSATPVALFAIGLSLGFSAIKNSYKSVTLVIIGKMLLAPLIFIGITHILHISSSPSMMIAIFETAMPTMTLAGVMVMKAKLDSNLAVSAIAFGLLFSAVSIPFWVWMLY